MTSIPSRGFGWYKLALPLLTILPMAAQPPFQLQVCHNLGETITVMGHFVGWAAFNPSIPFAQHICLIGYTYDGPLLPVRGDHMADDPLKALPLGDEALVTGELGRSSNGMVTLTITSIQDIDASIKARIAEWNRECYQWQEEAISSTFPQFQDKAAAPKPEPVADPFSHRNIVGQVPTRDDIKGPMGISRPAGSACGISAPNIYGLSQLWVQWRSQEEDLKSWVRINAVSSTSGTAAGSGIQLPVAAPGEKANPYQKFVEISGMRFAEDPKDKEKTIVKFVITNHADHDMNGLSGTVAILSRSDKSGQPVAGFTFRTSLGPQESKDLTTALTTKMKTYELPDWQFAQPVLQITAPGGASGR